MRSLSIVGKEKVFFGVRKSDNQRIFMTKPSWACGWYWSFGYLGNHNEHYHLSGYKSKTHLFKDEKGAYVHLTENRNKNMADCLLEDYELSEMIKENIWSFCEQTLTVYTLKAAYEVFNRGGSHMTTHPLQALIKNETTAETLAKDLLPQLLQKFWDDFGGKGE
jgi:hypothetical protein